MMAKNTPAKLRVTDAIELIAMRQGVNHSDLASMCGITKQAISRRFERRRNISVGAAAQMAEALGYELALVPMGSDYPIGSYRVEAALAEKHRLGGRR